MVVSPETFQVRILLFHSFVHTNIINVQLINHSLCDDFYGTNAKDVASLFSSIANNIMNIVQYNKDNRAFEGKYINTTLLLFYNGMI